MLALNVLRSTERVSLCRSSSILQHTRWRSGQAQPRTPEAPTQRRTVSPPGKRTAQHRPHATPTPNPALAAKAGAAAATDLTTNATSNKNANARTGASASAAPAATGAAGMAAEQAAKLQKAYDAESMISGLDVWSAKLPTFDVTIPTPTPPNASFLQKFSIWRSNFDNTFRNWIAMWRMAEANAFPGARIQPGFFGRLKSQLTHIDSVAPDAWVNGIREAALKSYMEAQVAIAEGEFSILKRYTCQEYYDNAVKLARAYKRPDRRITWSLLSENSPCRIVSMRAVEANFSSSLKPGTSRLACQVLVRFDTLQSIKVQSLRSNRGHGTDPEVKTKTSKVVEYLVLEKRLWQDVPWSIRERVYEGMQEKFLREADLL